MAYLRDGDFDIAGDVGRSAVRALGDDDYNLQKRIERATESYSMPLTLARDTEFTNSSLPNISSNRESRVQELEYELRRYQQLEEKHSETVRQLRQLLEATEKESSELSKSRSKTQLTINALQADNRQLQDQIAGLEIRLRRHLEERDETNQNALHWERNYEQLRHVLCKVMFPDGLPGGRSHDAILTKLEAYFDEQTKLKLQSIKLQEELARTREEARSEREALKKVLDELERAKIKAAAMELLKEEKEVAMIKQKQLEEELKKMEERLVRSHERYENVQSEVRNYQSQLADVDALTRRQTLTAEASALELKSFKETLAALLSDVYSGVQPTEESVTDKIRQLIISKQEAAQVSRHLEEKLQELSKQLEEQAHLHRNAVQRARKAEEEAEGLKKRLKVAEGELTATDILKDGLKADKEKYVEFCQQLAHVMKLDSIADELGMELNGDALLARAEQLSNMEQENVAKRRSQTLVLEKQLKEVKKQLESKDLHLDALRKKLASVESEASHKAEKDWQDLLEKFQRQKKQSDKLEKQLTESNMTVNQMTQHRETAETLRRSCEDQRKTIMELEKQLAESEQVRAKQAKKIRQLKTVEERSEAEMGQHQHDARVAESNVDTLTEEIQRLQQQLSGVVQREKQLLDLRQVIARMLGLDAQTLAVPDYEIIRRLEALVETQNELALASRKNDNDNDIRRSYQPRGGLTKSSSSGVEQDRTGPQVVERTRRQAQTGRQSGVGNMTKRYK